METHLKERLTGGLILVALLVIVAPEILRGPAAEQPAPEQDVVADTDGPPLRTYSMELGASARPEADQSVLTPQVVQGASSSTVAAPSPAPAPAPSSSPPPRAAVAQNQPNSAAAVPAPAPAPAAASSPRATAPTAAPASPPSSTAAPTPAGNWWVQLGSFSQQANAQQLAQTLTQSGFPAQVSSTSSQGKQLYRVRAGPVADRAAAQALQARLTRAGHKGSSLVAP